MFHNYLKVTLRHLFRRRTYTALNMGGMGIGLATGLLLLFWVQHEMSFDKFHRNGPELYRVNASVKGFDVWEATPQPVATFARQHLPEVALVARVTPMRRKEMFKVGEKRFFEDRYGMVDSTFFQVFDFPLVEGNPGKPFQDAKSIVLSVSAAKRFFGLENPVGKTIEHGGRTFTVTGVMRDFPDNSTYRFDFVLNNDLRHLRCLEQPESCYALPEADWGNYNTHTWLLLQPGADREALAKKLTDALYKSNKDLEKDAFSYNLQPLSTLHLYLTDGSPGQIKLVRVFFAIAVLILLLAGVNYVNLATALATQRVKEISVRKIVGAERRHLFAQFWLETAVLLGGSLLVAMLLMEAAAPFYQSLAGKTFSLEMLGNELWKVVALTFLGVWIFTGVYPALLLSSFRPALALKGEWLPGKVGSLRKSLIVLQFSASAALLICAFVIRRQLQFMQEKDLGFETEQVFEMPIMNFTKEFDFVKAEVQKLPGVYDVTAYNGGIFRGVNSTDELSWEAKAAGENIVIQQLAVAPNFLDFFKIPLVEGKAFDDNSSTTARQVLLNELAVRKMGLKNPVGQTVTFHSEPYTVIGIVKDIHLTSMREAIEPAIYYLDPEVMGTVYIKTTGKDAPALIAAAEQFWKTHQPDFPFEYHFISERYASLYEKETKARSLFEAFSLVALLISCLGLFGLAMHAAERRTKEIGIRKVLGATVGSVVGLLSKDFLKLVIVSLVIASPVAWWLMNKWLSDFAYRIEIGWWVYLAAGAVAMAVAFLTVGFHGVRSGLANPVKALRSE